MGAPRALKGPTLTPKQRVQGAVEIIGKASRADIEATVSQLDKMIERSKRFRSQDSGKQKRFAREYGAALRKVIGMMRKAPYELQVPAALGAVVVSVPALGIDKEVFDDHEHLLRHLMLLNWICERGEKSKLGKPKPDAFEKRLATEAALYLLKTHGIKPTTTKTNKFCRLAAVLYGNKSADLQHQCRKLSDERKSAAKTVPVLR